MSEAQTTALAVAGDFAVSRTSKAGKTTYRGALGVITSGNATERASLAAVAIGTAISNNNFRSLMREVCRVFPESSLKKAANVVMRDGDLHFLGTVMVDGVEHTTCERFDPANPNKVTSHLYAKAVLSALSANGKEIKGEKKLYAGFLADMLDGEAQRIAQLALAGTPAPTQTVGTE